MEVMELHSLRYIPVLCDMIGIQSTMLYIHIHIILYYIYSIEQIHYVALSIIMVYTVKRPLYTRPTAGSYIASLQAT